MGTVPSQIEVPWCATVLGDKESVTIYNINKNCHLISVIRYSFIRKYETVILGFLIQISYFLKFIFVQGHMCFVRWWYWRDSEMLNRLFLPLDCSSEVLLYKCIHRSIHCDGGWNYATLNSMLAVCYIIYWHCSNNISVELTWFRDMKNKYKKNLWPLKKSWN